MQYLLIKYKLLNKPFSFEISSYDVEKVFFQENKVLFKTYTDVRGLHTHGRSRFKSKLAMIGPLG